MFKTERKKKKKLNFAKTIMLRNKKVISIFQLLTTYNNSNISDYVDCTKKKNKKKTNTPKSNLFASALDGGY